VANIKITIEGREIEVEIEPKEIYTNKFEDLDFAIHFFEEMLHYDDNGYYKEQFLERFNLREKE
jgi:hypothetical protein